MAFYALGINAVDKALQPDWTLHDVANGRSTFECKIQSLDASYRPAQDAAVVFAEGVLLASYTNPGGGAAPTTLVTQEPHGIVSGHTVEIYNDIVVGGTYTATRIDTVTFSIPLTSSPALSAASTGYARRLIFGGEVDRPDEGGLGGHGVTPIETTISAIDFKARTERRFVSQTLLADTLTNQLTALLVYLPGVTLHPAQATGPSMPQRTCDWAAKLLVKDVLDAMAVAAGGWIWTIDPYNRLRMFDPAAEIAPVDVIDGNGVAIGDIKIRRPRAKFANRVVLLFKATATSAYGFFLLPANPSDGQQVVIGSTTYTFKNTPSATHDVQIEVDAETSMDALIAAAADSTQVTTYLFSGSGTAAVMKTTAIAAGTSGNSIGVSTTCTGASWVTEGGGPISTLDLGTDESLTNIAIKQDKTSIDARGVWDFVDDTSGKDLTVQADADAMAAAVLAQMLVRPVIVVYDTYALGLAPGQTQTVAVADRGVNDILLIIDVVTKSARGKRVRRTVTAITGGLLGAVFKPQDLYRQWLRGGSVAA